MKRLIGIVSVLCLSSFGCMIDASKLAGYSNPKLKVNYGRSGFTMEAGSDFSGKAEGHYNPETHQADAKIEITSAVSPVVAAEGERADHLVELRKVEAAMLVEMHRLVGENIKAIGEAAGNVAKAAATLGLGGGGANNSTPSQPWQPPATIPFHLNPLPQPTPISTPNN